MYHKLIFALSVIGCLGFTLAGCSGAKTMSEANATATSTCPMCKAAFEYVVTPKGVIMGKKVVSHTCPMCKKAWTAGIDPASTCAQCAQAELNCPVCAKAAGK